MAKLAIILKKTNIQETYLVIWGTEGKFTNANTQFKTDLSLISIYTIIIEKLYFWFPIYLQKSVQSKLKIYKISILVVMKL